MQRTHILTIAAGLSLALAGCGGGTAGFAPPVPGGATVTGAPNAAPLARANAPLHDPDTAGQINAASINILNAVGASVNEYAEENAAEHASGSVGTGACHNGLEFYVPDRAGDPDSSKTQYFYGRSCGQLARDSVHKYTSTGSNSETVTLTISNYRPSGQLFSTRTTTAQLTNATFDAYGFPIVSDGFVREASSQLTVGTVKTLDNDNEFIVAPSSNGSSTFCNDSAGYNATGIARLNETFGWAGGNLSGGTRTVNADGSVTWAGSRNATSYEGPIGSLSIAQGTQNSACPIATPAYTISGGNAKGSSVAAVSATFLNGWLKSLSASRVSLSGGYSLTLASNAGIWPTNIDFVSGTVSYHGTQVATFNTNALGDGVITVTKTGAKYVIIAWVVAR